MCKLCMLLGKGKDKVFFFLVVSSIERGETERDAEREGRTANTRHECACPKCRHQRELTG